MSGILHAKTSGLPADSGVTSVVQPSDWYAAHTLDSVAPSGLTGATTATRYVGGTAAVAPTTGTFSTGDFVVTQSGSIYICTAGGSPGTWTAVSRGSAFKAPVQEKSQPGGSANSQAATFDSTPTNGNLIVLCSANEGAHNITGIVQTNVTWTKVAESTASTAPHAEIWKGVVAGSPGSLITVSYSGTATCGFVASEWSGVTGTLDQSATATNQAQTANGNVIPTITPTSSSALTVFCGAESTFTTYFAWGGLNLIPFTSSTVGVLAAGGNFSVIRGFAAAFGFIGTVPVYGKVFNQNGGTFSGVTVSLI